MPFHLQWSEIVLRLVLACAAGALIGLNRTERDKPAGLRTALLVCLAAAASMIQANLLLPTSGKDPTSFSVLDLMRLPLGILTGMGFIGAGAIIRKKGSVEGITTAAALWLATVIGLCLGGGQIGLGLLTLTLGFAALAGLRRLEANLKRDCHGVLMIVMNDDGPAEELLEKQLAEERIWITRRRMALTNRQEKTRRTIRWEVRWHGRPTERMTPLLLDRTARHPGILSISWSG